MEDLKESLFGDTQIPEPVADNEFRDRIHMRLDDDGPREVFPRPFFMAALHAGQPAAYLREERAVVAEGDIGDAC